MINMNADEAVKKVVRDSLLKRIAKKITASLSSTGNEYKLSDASKEHNLTKEEKWKVLLLIAQA